jgi:hypothetical protein
VTSVDQGPVTRYELELALQPLRSGYRELDSKVDEVLRRLDRADGRHEATAAAGRSILDSARFWVTTSVALLGIIVSAIATIVYLKATHSA